ncbi:MAG TPA: hypothetical protein VF741_09845 [Candidatus Aquilonibacter sp.]
MAAPAAEKRAPRLGAALAVLASIALSLALPNRYVFGPHWIIEAADVILFVLFFISVIGHSQDLPRWLGDGAVLVVVIIVTVMNLLSLIALILLILYHVKDVNGHRLLGSAVVTWVGNVLAFAMLYWLIDGGGPDVRARSSTWHADFVFPQPARQADADPNWRPNFLDYLFLAFSTATAFSPTDTLPLTTRARMVMMIEATASFLTIAIIAARAVNILS